MKTSRDTVFPIITLWELLLICCHGNQSSDPIWPKTKCSLSPVPMMLQIKFDRKWWNGLRDIYNWKVWVDEPTEAQIPYYYKLTLWAFGSVELKHVWNEPIRRASDKSKSNWLKMQARVLIIRFNKSLVMKKTAFCICENKDADQLHDNREADQAFVCATRIVQLLYFLNTEFNASSHRLWLYSPVCVGPGQKPRRLVFSQRGS